MPPFDKLWMCLYARLGEYSFLLIGSNHNYSVCGSKGITYIFLLASNLFGENMHAVENNT